MKTRIIIAMLMLYSTGVFAQQTNGAINGKTENGVRKEVSVDSFTANRFALMVKDSTLNALFAAKDSTKDRKWISIDNFPTTYASTQSGTWILGANSGVDIGDVTINNASGGSAVNIQDGGNTITVDGTVAATQSGTWNITNVSGTVSLPTNAATAANQSTEIVSLGLLDDAVNNDGGVVSGRGLLIIGSDGANARNVKTNTAGNIETKAWSVDSTNLAGINTKLGGNIAVTGTFWQATQPVSGTFWQATQPVSFTRLKASTDTVAISGSISATAGATAIFDSTYTAVTMDTAGLGAKASSQTVGWQSDSVGLRQHKVTDVKIGISLDMASGAPANDKAVYVYVYPLWHDGSAMNFTDGGTGTLPSGANSSYTIATPNDLTLLGVLSYTTSDMVVSKQFMLSSVYPTMPDGFGLIIVNYSGVALAASTHKVVYSLVTKVQR